MNTGYSGTSQSKKLGIKPGVRLAIHRAPSGWRLDEEPSGAIIVDDGGLAGAGAVSAGPTDTGPSSGGPSEGGSSDRGPSGSAADVLIAFARSEAEFLSDLDELAERIFPAGALWIAWPRKAAGHVSDVTENLIRDTVLERGLVDVKVAAISHDWSGLKIVWRVEHRTR